MKQYLSIDLTRGDSKPWPWFLQALGYVLPKANPDLDPFIDQAKTWWLEVDESGSPLREIGFDHAGVPIVLAPVAGNFGFLIDAGDDWSEYPVDPSITDEQFDTVWNDLWSEFAAVHERNTVAGG